MQDSSIPFVCFTVDRFHKLNTYNWTLTYMHSGQSYVPHLCSVFLVLLGGSPKGLVKVSNLIVSLEPQVACLPDRARRIREPAAPTPALSTGSVGHPQAPSRGTPFNRLADPGTLRDPWRREIANGISEMRSALRRKLRQGLIAS